MSDIVELGGGRLELSATAAFRVLLLDDQWDWLKASRDFLVSQGIAHVDTVRTIEEANRFIAKTDYDGVIADVWLEGGLSSVEESKHGDEWLLREPGLAKTGHKAAMTGDLSLIAERDQLEASAIAVIKKGSQEELAYWRTLSVAAEEKRRQTLSAAASELQSLARPEASGYELGVSDAVMKAASDIFMSWTATLSDKTDETIWLGSRAYSPEQLAEEVRLGSEVGNSVMAMFVRHISYQLGVAKSPFDRPKGK